MAGTITINDPHSGCREVDANDETDLSGSSSQGTLKNVYAQIWETLPDPIPAKPFPSHGANATQGTVNADGTWSIDGVPVPNFVEGNTYTVVVWSDFLGEKCYAQTQDEFTARTSCNGSAEGSSGASQFVMQDTSESDPASPQGTQAYRKTTSPIADIAPRRFRVTLDVTAGGAVDPLASLSAAGLLAVRDILLDYDPAGSNGSQAVWRSKRCSKSGLDWTLTVVRNGRGSTAELTLRKLTPHHVSTPLAWSTAQWDACVGNVLNTEADNPLVAALPAVTVQPA